MPVNHWFSSDFHLWHHNIIAYGERPFANLNEMHDALLERHNAIVKPQDHVSMLGDMCLLRGGKNQRDMFIREMKKYNGHLRLYLGNHDHWPVKVYLEAGFEKIYATWRCEEGFICSHFPLHPRSLNSATACVHGHTHQHADYDPVILLDNEFRKPGFKPRVVPYINLSVERTNYTPVHKDEILARIAKAQEALSVPEPN